jgi:aspartyl-tRNA(Asn)/glutamyl-tRNA(Gln) amidotransferase subunit A
LPAIDLARLSAAELLRHYRRGTASPAEVVDACLALIERYEGKVNAFCLIDAEGARQAARESEARWRRGEPRGLVDGVPCTVKDLIVWKGKPTRRGSLSTGDAPAPEAEDAPAVARLREHGAVFLGKTTTPEFGWKGVTDNPRGDVTRNPFDIRMTSGGSSGGAAAAAALGIGALHIGTDGGGSIRIPAGFSGICGMKATFGRVPAWPLSPFGTVSHIGPMTRTVEDMALMLTVLSEPDARDWYALPPEGKDYRVGLDGGVRGLRIAASADLGHVEVDPEIRASFEAAVARLADLGARVEQRDPGIGSTRDLFARTWFPAAAHVLRGLAPEARERVDPGFRAIAREGEQATPAILFDTEAERRALGIAMQRFFGEYDLLLTPTLPIAAFPAGQEVPDPARYPRWIDWASFSFPFNLTQQPAATVPCGLTRAGLPIGLQIVGPKYADALVLRAARAYESSRPWSFPEAPVERA